MSVLLLGKVSNICKIMTLNQRIPLPLRLFGSSCLFVGSLIVVVLFIEVRVTDLGSGFRPHSPVHDPDTLPHPLLL